MTLRPITAAVIVYSQVALLAQAPLPPGFVKAPEQSKPASTVPTPTPAQPKPTAVAPAQNAAPGTTPAKPQQEPGAPVTITPSTGGLTLQNASLREVIDILAQRLRINYIIDPRVNGAVTINTYGETKNIDNRTLLDTILRINNAAMIQVGDIYRIVPLSDVQRLPLKPDVNGRPTVEDDRTMLNLMFLKYATVDEVAKLLDPFLGEGGKMWSYGPANLLMIQDSRRNMSRLLELISLFDNDTFANQRIRLYEVKNGRPSDIAKELESILRSISLNEKVSPVKLLPIDRINTLVAVAANPGVFKDVENWLSKIDIEVEASAGTIGNFVYRVRYGCAPTIAGAIMGLYSNNPYMAMGMMGMAGMSGGAGCGGMGGGMMGGGMGGMYGGGMYGGGLYGGGMYGGGMGGMYGAGMMGGGMYGAGMMGGGMMGGGMYGGMPGGMYGGNPYAAPTAAAAGTTAAGAAGQNLTGQYLGAGTTTAGGQPSSLRIVPNPFDNTLLIQGTRQDYESILRLLKDIDVPPRQVLVEAKIYEVTLTGDLRFGVQAYLTQRGASLGADVTRPGTRAAVGNVSAGGVNMSIGALVGASRELLALIQTGELTTKAKVVSAPSIVATDSIPASINIGDEVPTLTAQAVTGAQQGGNSLFANSIQSRNSGTTLNIMARVNPSGIVTLIINQEVSTPVAPDPGAAIQSPSFSKRNVSTQVTLQDGDTIAIGGIINETNSWSKAGVPGLSRVPVLGAAFGGQRQQKGRTELIVFFTPRVIYDMNDMNDATEELKTRLRKLSKDVRNLQ